MPINNPAYVALTNPKHLSDVGLRVLSGVVEGPYRNDVLDGQSGLSALLTPECPNPTLLVCVPHIVRVSALKQMVGIAARPIIALVANTIAFCYWTFRYHKSHTMSRRPHTIQSSLAVAGLFINLSIPNPTRSIDGPRCDSGLFFNTGPKPVSERRLSRPFNPRTYLTPCTALFYGNHNPTMTSIMAVSTRKVT
jgi:hypothetical protein